MAFNDFIQTILATVRRLLTKPSAKVSERSVPLFLHNTLSGEKERFTPLNNKTVKMYNCGPTVYGPQHIGNLSMFVFVDILRRTLEWNGYAVKQVINFTDVGHLVSDGDEGEDKMTKGLKREGLTPTIDNMKTLGKKYAEHFLEQLRLLNINTELVTFPYASDYIPAQIAMVKTLEEKGYAYKGKKGVYFDTTKFPDYGKLGNINLEGLKEGARIGPVDEKRHATDFLLWKFDRRKGWDSPWGKGFPGWHIECSAMSHSILGDQLDIHTGGIEHIPVHHNNEIAQSEAALGKKPFSRFWLHRAHLQIEGAKIAKSVGNTIFLEKIVEKGFSPLAFRYLLLGAHYRTPASFTWEALASADTTLKRLYAAYDVCKSDMHKNGGAATRYLTRFAERVNDDLDTPGALAVMWELIKDDSISNTAKIEALNTIDNVFGLNISTPRESSDVSVSDLDVEVQSLLEKREGARKEKNWAEADKLRAEIESRGYELKDTSDGVKVQKK